MVSAASGSVAGNESGAHLWIAFGGLELARHTREKPCENKLFFYADHRIVRAGHAYVGLIGGTLWEDALVSGGNMGVSAEQGSDAAVKIPAESHFFAGSFAMEVEKDNLCADFAE